MSPLEVSFRDDIPRIHLNGVMEKFGQDSPNGQTMYMRKYQMTVHAKALIDKEFQDSLKDQEIYDSVSNRKEFDQSDFAMEPDEEVTLILCYLSFLT